MPRRADLRSICLIGSGPIVNGQAELILARELAEDGVLDLLAVELIGASLESIRCAEDRELFREAVRRAGLKVPESVIVRAPEDLPPDLALPVVLRPAFTLGG